MKNSKKRFYGIVEGFFSYPLPIWSCKEMLETLKFIVKYAPNIDTYLYCPKNDIYVVQKWDKLLPAKELSELKKVIDYSKKITSGSFLG